MRHASTNKSGTAFLPTGGAALVFDMCRGGGKSDTAPPASGGAALAFGICHGGNAATWAAACHASTRKLRLRGAAVSLKEIATPVAASTVRIRNVAHCS